MKKILLLFVLMIATNNLFAETGKEAIDACIKAMSINNFSTFKTQKVVYSMQMSGQSSDVTHYKKGEDKERFEIKTAMGDQIIVKNGDKVFMIKPSEMEVPTEQWNGVHNYLTQYSITNFIGQLIKDNAPLELIGTEDFSGKSCKKIKTSEKNEGIDEMFIFTDAITNWITGVKMEIPEGGEITMSFSDMKKVKGAVYPSTISVGQGGQEAMKIKITSLEADADLPDSLFEK